MRIQVIIVVVACFLTEAASAQFTPLMKIPQGSEINPAVFLNGRYYFSGYDSVSRGIELMSTDGTAAGTFCVKDLDSTANSSLMENPTVAVNGLLFFRANDGDHGEELWRTDGTIAGTWMLKDIYPGVNTSQVTGLTVIDSIVYFAATDGFDTRGIWRSNGTAEGTYEIIKSLPGKLTSWPNNIFALNGSLMFSAQDSASGRTGLWNCNVFAQSISLVAPVRMSSQAGKRVMLGNVLIFAGRDSAVSGEALFRTDGTPGGTYLVKDIQPGYSSSPENLTLCNGQVFFTAMTDVGRELWRTDGTANGTRMVRDFRPGSLSGLSNTYKSAFTAFQNKLFFVADSGKGPHIWTSDGTEAGTLFFKNIQNNSAGPLNFIAHDNALYFEGHSAGEQVELWRSDGTPNGTVLVRVINTTDNGRTFNQIMSIDSFLFFAANDGAAGYELWRSDGTASGTFMVKDIFPGSWSSSPAMIGRFSGRLLLAADDRTHGRELWQTDGSASGTSLLSDIFPGTTSSSPKELTVAGGLLYFVTVEPNFNAHLWRSDGTSAGTVHLRQSYASNGTLGLHAFGDRLIFREWNSNVAGEDLVTGDGTLAGTHTVMHHAGANMRVQLPFSPCGNQILYYSYENTSSVLWRSDGTQAGTFSLGNVTVSPSASEWECMASNYIFVGWDAVKYGLWRCDESGAVQFLQEFPAAWPRNLDHLVSSGNSVFFTKQSADWLHRDLWRTDGTIDGTKEVRPMIALGDNERLDISHDRLVFFNTDPLSGEYTVMAVNTAGTTYEHLKSTGIPGTKWSSPQLQKFGRLLYFQSSDSLSGTELWRTDGTATGTTRVADLEPGLAGSNPVMVYTSPAPFALVYTTEQLYAFRDSISHAGIPAREKVNRLSVFPNPATAVLYIEMEDKSTSETNAVIHDLLGNQVAAQRITGSHAEIQTSDLPAGLYLLSVVSDGKSIAHRKVLITH